MCNTKNDQLVCVFQFLKFWYKKLQNLSEILLKNAKFIKQILNILIYFPIFMICIENCIILNKVLITKND